jgi:hypothetical protein
MVALVGADLKSVPKQFLKHELQIRASGIWVFVQNGVRLLASVDRFMFSLQPVACCL